MTLLTSLMWRNGDAISVCTISILELVIYWVLFHLSHFNAHEFSF